jgi:hypothetical protein
MNICEDAPAIVQGRELQEASLVFNLFATISRLFAIWHEVGMVFKNGLSTYLSRCVTTMRFDWSFCVIVWD